MTYLATYNSLLHCHLYIYNSMKESDTACPHVFPSIRHFTRDSNFKSNILVKVTNYSFIY